MRLSEPPLAVLLASLALAAPAQSRAQDARPSPAPILAERLIGRWTDSGDCTRYVAFRGDGSFRTNDGGEGSWRLLRGRLTISGGGPGRILTVRRLDATTLEVVNPDGSVGLSRRCPSVPPQAAQPGSASDRRP